MSNVRRYILAALALAIGLFFALIAWAYRPPIDPVPRPSPASFPAAQIERGGQLALLGSCQSCHSVSPIAAYGGGREVPTPFGMIYGANVSPSAALGIGRWSPAAFDRAVRQGVSRDGHQLYPAMPYEHMTRISDADMAALYAFLMNQPAIHAVKPGNRLLPPIDFRPVLVGWKALFFDAGRYQPNRAHNADWNHGAYLVEGISHCGSCHTPRNLLGAESGDHAFEGATVQGWKAPALIDRSGRDRWTADQVETYLRTGRGPDGEVARGPMREVVHNLSRAPAGDVHAIAVYISDMMGRSGQLGR